MPVSIINDRNTTPAGELVEVTAHSLAWAERTVRDGSSCGYGRAHLWVIRMGPWFQASAMLCFCNDEAKRLLFYYGDPIRLTLWHESWACRRGVGQAMNQTLFSYHAACVMCVCIYMYNPGGHRVWYTVMNMYLYVLWYVYVFAHQAQCICAAICVSVPVKEVDTIVVVISSALNLKSRGPRRPCRLHWFGTYI